MSFLKIGGMQIIAPNESHPSEQSIWKGVRAAFRWTAFGGTGQHFDFLFSVCLRSQRNQVNVYLWLYLVFELKLHHATWLPTVLNRTLAASKYKSAPPLPASRLRAASQQDIENKLPRAFKQFKASRNEIGSNNLILLQLRVLPLK